MKLCMIANPNSVHVHRWMQHFVDRGDTVHLIGIMPLRVDLPPGVIFHDATAWTRLPKLQYAAGALATHRLVRSIRPDIVHSHFIDGGGWLGAAANYHPFIATAYGSDLLVAPQRSWIFRRLARWVLARADHVVCWSGPLAQAARALGAQCEKISIVHNGVDTVTFRPDPTAAAAVRTQLNLSPGPIVVSMRALRAIYNPLDIARAIPLVLKAIPTAQFIILTYNHDPALLARFQATVQEAGAAQSVHYVPRLNGDHEIARFWQAADVAVSVASSDGTPMSVQEAMACGTACVLGDIPAFHGWIEHEENALLIPLHQPPALAAAIQRLLQDEPLQARLASNAVGYVQEHAARDIMMRRGEKIYGEQLAMNNVSESNHP